jgi:hypothetical protein
MNLRNSPLKISILIAIVHCIFGNAIGAKSDNTFIQLIFLPYSFIGGMSDFAGWDTLSVILELIGLIIMTIIFHPIGLWLYKEKSEDSNTKS